jgi:hypothetical protein
VTTPRKAGPTDRFLIRDGVTAREFDGDWIVLDLAVGNYYGLDEVAGIIWQRLGAGQSPSEIAAGLAQTHDGKESSTLVDVLRFVDELVERGLMKAQQ